MTDADGDRVGRTRQLDACLNGDSERVQPGGETANAYPWGCPWNPFTLGSVQGIQDGYATRLDTWAPVRLPVGRYTATVGARYVKAWRLDPEEAHVDVTVKVVRARRDRSDRMRGWRPAATPRRTDPGRRRRGPSHRGRAGPARRGRPARRHPVARPSVAAGLAIGLNRKGTLIRFAANVWNAGNSPLVIGFRTADQDVMAAYQYFFDTDGEQVAYQSVEDSGF